MMSTILKGEVLQRSGPAGVCRGCRGPGTMKLHPAGRDAIWQLLVCRHCGATYWVAISELGAAA